MKKLEKGVHVYFNKSTFRKWSMIYLRSKKEKEKKGGKRLNHPQAPPGLDLQSRPSVRNSVVYINCNLFHSKSGVGKGGSFLEGPLSLFSCLFSVP